VQGTGFGAITPLTAQLAGNLPRPFGNYRIATFRETFQGMRFSGFSGATPYFFGGTTSTQPSYPMQLSSPQEGALPVRDVADAANTLASNLGIATLLFYGLVMVVIALIIYIRQQASKEQRQTEANNQTLHKVIDTLREDKESDRKILMGVIEDNRQQIEIVRRVVDSIKSQDQALQVLLQKTSSILENRCHHVINR
jgi:hypothetical protein